MTQSELEAFLAVVRCGTVSGAAQQLFITQPALSRRLGVLEEELGYPLLQRGRGRRSVELTAQGRAFVPVAEKWLAIWQEAKDLKAKKAATSTTEAGRVGDRPYARGRSYKADRYDETK